MKETRKTIRITTKNSIYLQRLGYLDGRNGANTEANLSRLLNQCLTFLLEEGKYSQKDVCSPEELALSLIDFRIKHRMKKIKKLYAEHDKDVKERRKIEDYINKLRQETVRSET